nr:unnamed protein product [Callosobruchus chinensis]
MNHMLVWWFTPWWRDLASNMPRRR